MLPSVRSSSPSAMSQASSAPTQPYSNPAATSHAPMFSSSPISADKLYTKPPSPSAVEDEPRVSAILYRRISDADDDDDNDDDDAAMVDPRPLNIHLFPGINHLGRLNEEAEAANRVELGDPGLSVVIEIDEDDGLYLLYDCGSTSGVFLGHRETRARPGIRYFLTDGKLVRMGEAGCFWFHVLAKDGVPGCERSPSPSPPWKIHEHLGASTTAVGSAVTIGGGAVGCTSADAAKLAVRSGGASRDPGPLAPRRAVVVVQPGRLRRETAGVLTNGADPLAEPQNLVTTPPPMFAANGSSPLFLLGSPDPKDLGLTQMVNYDAGDFGDVYCGALSDTQPTSDYSHDDLSSMVHCPDDMETAQPAAKTTQSTGGGLVSDQLFASISLGHTQPPVDSQPRLLTQDSHYQAPSQQLSYSPRVTSSLRISGLRVAESPEPATVEPSQQSLEIPATQPTSPSRLPPEGQQRCGTVGASDMYLPQPSALVYAPSRVVVVRAAGPTEAVAPRYPYDFEGMDAYLQTLAESGLPPTQSDLEVVSSDGDGDDDDGRKHNQTTAGAIATAAGSVYGGAGDVALSSDFSQQFLSPPPPDQQSKEEAEKQRKPANRLLHAGERHQQRRHRRSIENYTDSGSSSDSDSAVSRQAPREPRAQSAGNTPGGTSRPLTTTPSQRFSVKPLGMSARARMRPQPQLRLQSSGSGASTPTTTTWLTGRTTTRSTAAAAPAASAVHLSAVTTPLSVLPSTADGFPDDAAMAPPLTASSVSRSASREHHGVNSRQKRQQQQQQQQQQRRQRQQRRHTQGAVPSLLSVAGSSAVAETDMRGREKASGMDSSWGSPGVQDTPSRAKHSSEMLYSSDENKGALHKREAGEKAAISQDPAADILLPSSPQLPHPSMLLQSRSADATTPGDKQPGMTRRKVPQPTRIPRLHLRCRDPVNDENDASGISGTGWINADQRTRTPDTSVATAVGLPESPLAGTANPRMGDATKSQQAVRRATASATLARRQSSVTPTATGHRGSLRESLRKLPGAKGVGRTGLTSKRRTTLRSARAALQPGSEEGSLTKRNSDAAASPATSNASGHLVQPRLTRQTSANSAGGRVNRRVSSAGAIERAMFTGFDDALERDRMRRTLESQGIRVTDDPLTADVCVSNGRLSRTLKILCSIGRGIPVVSPSWLAESPLPLTVALADAHLLADPTTESEWGISLKHVLETARALNTAPGGRLLLGGFCVYVAGDVENPSPKNLCIMVRAAGGHMLNDIWTGTAKAHVAATVNENSGVSGAGDTPGHCGIGRAISMEISDGPGQPMDLGSSSSTEPDSDPDDEDWTIETAGSSRRTAARSSRTTARKQLSSTSRHSLPLVIESPGVSGAGDSPAAGAGDPGNNYKRRRVDPDHSQSLFLDPLCGRHDMDYFLSARKAELMIPDDTRLLVVSGSEDPGTRRKWAAHQARVVLPEQIIQSIIHCSLMF